MKKSATVAQAKPVPKVNGKKKVQINSDRTDPFTRCLMDPLDPKSIGCQVPDPYPFPTQTYHIHQTSVIGAPSSSSVTSGAVAFLPNPCFSMIDYQHLGSLTSSNYAVTSTPMTQLSSTGTNSASALWSAITPSDLKSKLSTYRVVSWGIKISNLLPELSATGRIIVAYLPIGDTIPSYDELLGATTATVCDNVFDVPYAALNTSAILNLPTAMELSVGDLLHGDLELSGMYTNSNFWTFKSSRYDVVQETGTAYGFDSASVAATAISRAGYKDLTRCVGGAGIVIYFEGIPAGVSNAFQVETIYHLEGSPQIATTSNSVLLPSTMAKASIGTNARVENSMKKASKLENVINFIDKGAKFLNKNQDVIKRVAGIASMALL